MDILHQLLSSFLLMVFFSCIFAIIFNIKGEYFRIKDSDLQPRELTEAEKDKYVAFDYEIGNPRSNF
jgi:hypothetical protein